MTDNPHNNNNKTQQFHNDFADLGFSPVRVVEKGGEKRGEGGGEGIGREMGVGMGGGKSGPPPMDVDALIRNLPDISYMIPTPTVSHF